ncbi:MAG: putative serine/threonine-protein kinase Nek5, partial [Streblomastix strix]
MANMESIDNFSIERALPEGSFGRCSMAQHRTNRKHYVIKEIPLGEADASDIQNSLVSFTLDIPKTLKSVSQFDSVRNIYFVFEYQRNSLEKLVQTTISENKKIPIKQVGDILLETALSLEGLHNQDIVHRNLKPTNCFLTKDKQVIFGDFGIPDNFLLRKLSFSFTRNEFLQFYSPELIQNNGRLSSDDEEYNKKTDIWSLGVIGHYLMFLRLPFQHKLNDKLKQLILNTLPAGLKDTDRKRANPLSALLFNMLEKDPDNRPTLHEVIETLKKIKADEESKSTEHFASDKSSKVDESKLNKNQTRELHKQKELKEKRDKEKKLALKRKKEEQDLFDNHFQYPEPQQKNRDAYYSRPQDWMSNSDLSNSSQISSLNMSQNRSQISQGSFGNRRQESPQPPSYSPLSIGSQHSSQQKPLPVLPQYKNIARAFVQTAP